MDTVKLLLNKESLFMIVLTLTNNNPNDADLGAEVRKLIGQYNKSNSSIEESVDLDNSHETGY